MTQCQNCLGYALRFWANNPEYRLYYDSNHVINSREHVSHGNYLPAEDFGYTYFVGAFEFAGLLDPIETALLAKYFNVPYHGY